MEKKNYTNRDSTMGERDTKVASFDVASTSQIQKKRTTVNEMM